MDKIRKHYDILSEYWIQSVVTDMPQEKRVYINEEYNLIVDKKNKQVTLWVHEYECETVVYGIHVTKSG